MRFIRRSLIGVFLLSLTIALLAFAGGTVWSALQTRWAEEPQQRPARERVFAANVVTVGPETIRPALETFGEVRARRTLEVRAAAQGEVIWLSESFEEGGQVIAGDLIARIDPSKAQSAVDTARADLTEAQADLRDAEQSVALADADIAAAEEQARLRQSALQRQLDLQNRGVGSAAAVETAELAASAARQAVLTKQQARANATARADQAAITVERRKIALADAERQLSDTEIYAEFSGVLNEATAVVGGLVSANERLAQLVDPTALEVVFRVSTPQYARFLGDGGRLVGADVTARIDVLGVNLEATGQISRESAAVGEGQTGRQLFAQIGEAPGFRPGDFVAVTIQEPPIERVARLPATAVDANGGVLVVGEEDRLEVADVEIIRREGDDVIVRARGLAGRELVATQTPLLGAGIRIRPIRPGTVEVPQEPELLTLDPERRARIVAFVEANAFMPDEVKSRILGQLQQEQVPAQVVERIESRMGG